MAQGPCYTTYANYLTAGCAQEFELSETGSITNVNLYLSISGAGTKHASIYSSASDLPDTNLGDSDEVNCEGINQGSLTAFPFSTPVYLLGATKYFVLTPTPDSTAVGGGYTDHKLYYWTGSWNGGFIGSFNMLFCITYTPTIVATTNYLKFYRRTRFPGSITGL